MIPWFGLREMNHEEGDPDHGRLGKPWLLGWIWWCYKRPRFCMEFQWQLDPKLASLQLKPSPDLSSTSSLPQVEVIVVLSIHHDEPWGTDSRLSPARVSDAKDRTAIYGGQKKQSIRRCSIAQTGRKIRGKFFAATRLKRLFLVDW